MAFLETSVALSTRSTALRTIRRLVPFYVQEHIHVLPHSAFRGQTSDKMLIL